MNSWVFAGIGVVALGAATWVYFDSTPDAANSPGGLGDGNEALLEEPVEQFEDAVEETTEAASTLVEEGGLGDREAGLIEEGGISDDVTASDDQDTETASADQETPAQDGQTEQADASSAAQTDGQDGTETASAGQESAAQDGQTEQADASGAAQTDGQDGMETASAGQESAAQEGQTEQADASGAAQTDGQDGTQTASAEEQIALGRLLSPDGYDPEEASRALENSPLLSESEKTTFLMALRGAEGQQDALELVLMEIRTRLDI